MWDMEAGWNARFDSFNKYLNADLKRKRWAVAPALRCDGMKGEWNLRKEERKKTRGLRGEYVEACTCIRSFFVQVFLREILKQMIQLIQQILESLPDGS